MESIKRVVVIGGGIGGLTLGLALRKKGLAVKVFEKYDHFQHILTMISSCPEVTVHFALENSLAKYTSSSLINLFAFFISYTCVATSCLFCK